MSEQIISGRPPKRDIKIHSTDLDIRDLTSVSDSVEVKQATASNLNANVSATDLDIRNLSSAQDDVSVTTVKPDGTNTMPSMDSFARTGYQTVQLGDSYSVDAFGRLRISEPSNRFDVEFIYDKQEEIMDEVTVGTGSVTHNTATRDLTLAVGSTTTNDEAAMYSYDIPYTPGCSQQVDITGVLDLANIGTGNAELFVRTSISGSVAVNTYDQSTWSNATSGVNWNFSHILAIDFQSLKVGRIRFGLVQNGVYVPLKEVYNDNVRNSGYWQIPSLPAYWRIWNDANNTYMEMGYGDTANGIGLRYKVTKNASATMKAICATVKSEGGRNLVDMAGYNKSADRAQTAKTISTTLVPLISIRPRSTFASLTNRMLIIPTNITITTDGPIRVAVFHNNTLTNASWANVDTTESGVEYDVAATALTNGHRIFSEYISAGKNNPYNATSLLGRVLLWLRRNGSSGILTLAAIRTGASDASVFAGIGWKEIR